MSYEKEKSYRIEMQSRLTKAKVSASMSFDNFQGSKKPTGCVTPASPWANHDMGYDDQ